MLHRLEAHLRRRRESGRRLLVPFLTAGFPDEEVFQDLLLRLSDWGADAIEIGIPFSDPLADGPTIQRASQRALEGGASLAKTLESLAGMRERIGVPVVLMTYMNPVFAMGIDQFCAAARECADGVLVSDLPPGEMPELERALKKACLDRIVLIAPTTSPARIPMLAGRASGFIYLVTRTGVTGAGGDFSNRLSDQVALIRSSTDLPVVAGFGIRSKDDVGRMSGISDGCVIGARLIEIIESAADRDETRRLMGEFLHSIRTALDRP